MQKAGWCGQGAVGAGKGVRGVTQRIQSHAVRKWQSQNSYPKLSHKLMGSLLLHTGINTQQHPEEWGPGFGVSLRRSKSWPYQVRPVGPALRRLPDFSKASVSLYEKSNDHNMNPFPSELLWGLKINRVSDWISIEQAVLFFLVIWIFLKGMKETLPQGLHRSISWR